MHLLLAKQNCSGGYSHRKSNAMVEWINSRPNEILPFLKCYVWIPQSQLMFPKEIQQLWVIASLKRWGGGAALEQH